jgi:hypothetical protein
MNYSCARTQVNRLRHDPCLGHPPALPAPSHEEIARLAYAYWEARGRRHGSPQEDWFRAERELLRRRRASTGATFQVNAT